MLCFSLGQYEQRDQVSTKNTTVRLENIVLRDAQTTSHLLYISTCTAIRIPYVGPLHNTAAMVDAITH